MKIDDAEKVNNETKVDDEIFKNLGLDDNLTKNQNIHRRI